MLPTSFESAQRYTWGDSCDGWHFLNAPDLSVIYERMPPDTFEKKHRHAKAKQFFFITKGTAEIWLDGRTHTLAPNQGLEIPPGKAHQIFNRGSENLKFVLVSSPHAHGDRENLD